MSHVWQTKQKNGTHESQNNKKVVHWTCSFMQYSGTSPSTVSAKFGYITKITYLKLTYHTNVPFLLTVWFVSYEEEEDIHLYGTS